MNPLQRLFPEHGQSVWLDFVSRGFVGGGGLARLVEEDGLRGVTSNPAIFEKAIGAGHDYDEALAAAAASGEAAIGDLFEGLAVADIRAAADILLPVHRESGGQDGFVSLEVSPYLADDTAGTLAEARRLWAAVERPNLMVKVPATPAGLPAIRELTADGINVNVTLLFSRDVYREVAEAYLAGLEARAAAGHDLGGIGSVASFFVSRIDTVVDSRLDALAGQAADEAERARLEALRGAVAIANAKGAYRIFGELFSGPRWEALAARGARPQRLLWASTGVKNPRYRDTLYVEELIGPDTVNTMPPATLDAFRDHGRLARTLDAGQDEAERVLADLGRTGIDLEAIAQDLVRDGVRLFVEAADTLLGAVAAKRTALLGDRLNRQALSLGPALDAAYREELARWRREGLIRRLWAGDAALWTGGDEARWLGWLTVAADGLARLDEYEAFARDVAEAGFADAVVLGMGGSSLGPEVLAEVFGRRDGFPRLRVLDSTEPAEVLALDRSLDLSRTLFIVASKSGSTLEPNVFRDYFLGRVRETGGAEAAGRHFVAVTDPGSKMEAAARADGFRDIFLGRPSVGGRFSVLSAFGLVPAAAAGIDLRRFLLDGEAMARACGPDVPPDANPGVALGVAMGLAAKAGRDKLTIVASPPIASFGAWAEQLVAESTGKGGQGIIPVDGEPLGPPALYGGDRLFAYLRLDGDPDDAQDAAVAALEEAGQPVIRIGLSGPDRLPQEFFRWEMATAVAGAVLGLHPFDQPDVEASKVKTRELTEAAERTGALPAETPVAGDDLLSILTDPANAAALREAGAGADPASWIAAHLGRIRPGDYVAFLAYLERNGPNREALEETRAAVFTARHVATCLGFGPRFLHSTGQAYKGGPDTGVFLQVTADAPEPVPIPGRALGFAAVVAAQARGDFDVLAERGRRALRVHLKGGDVGAGLARLDALVRAALG